MNRVTCEASDDADAHASVKCDVNDDVEAIRDHCRRDRAALQSSAACCRRANAAALAALENLSSTSPRDITARLLERGNKTWLLPSPLGRSPSTPKLLLARNKCFFDD